MSVEVCVTVTGSSVEDVQGQLNDLRVSSPGPEAPPAAAVSPSPAAAAAASPEPTPADPSTPPTESQQPPWAPASS